MIVPASNRDTEITFQERTDTQDSASGAWTHSWADVTPTEWAEVRDVLPSRAEGVAQGIDITRRPCRVRTLYRADVTPQMRVKIGSRVLEIVSGPVALGSPARPDGMEMLCVEYSTQGETP